MFDVIPRTMRSFILPLVLSCILLPLSAVPAKSVLDGVLLDKALSGAELRASLFNKTSPLTLAPVHRALAALQASLASEKPGVVVEALFAWKQRTKTPVTLLEAANILQSISTLQGIEYYSESRKKMRLFYEESWRIAGPSSREKLLDTPLRSMAELRPIYSWQKDLTFGGNVYRYDFSSGDDYILVETTNITDLWYGIVPIAAAGKLKNRMLLVMCDDAIVFWTCSSASVGIIPGVRERLEDSFGNRAQAISQWFARSLFP